MVGGSGRPFTAAASCSWPPPAGSWCSEHRLADRLRVALRVHERLVHRPLEALRHALLLAEELLGGEVVRHGQARRGLLVRGEHGRRALGEPLAHERLDHPDRVDAAGLQRGVGVGEGHLEVLDLLVVRADFFSAVLIVSGPTLFSEFTAIVLPSRSLADLIELPFFTSTASQAWSADAFFAPSTPWPTIWRGMFFEPAMISEVVFEKPMSSSPDMVAVTISGPPLAILGWIVSFSFLKKPCFIPT